MAASEPTYTWFQKTRPLEKGLDTVFGGPNTNPQKRLWFSTPNKLINLNDTKRILHKRGCVLVLKNENSVIWENILQTSHFELSHHAQHTHILCTCTCTGIVHKWIVRWLCTIWPFLRSRLCQKWWKNFAQIWQKSFSFLQFKKQLQKIFIIFKKL